MTLKEIYPRPCFAACSECGVHGVIIFKDGSHSELIMSIEGGKDMLKGLVASGILSSDESDLIGDHLECSDLVATEYQALILAVTTLAIHHGIENIGKAECSKWN